MLLGSHKIIIIITAAVGIYKLPYPTFDAIWQKQNFTA